MVWPALLVRAPLRMTLEGVDSLGYRRGGEVARAPRVPPCIQRCRRKGHPRGLHSSGARASGQRPPPRQNPLQSAVPAEAFQNVCLELIVVEFGTTVRLLS